MNRKTKRKQQARYTNLKNKQLWKKKLAKYMVKDLQNYGPANLIHVEVLSAILGTAIRVWKSRGRFYRTIDNRTNENMIRKPIDLEYHEQPANYAGHWTLLGNKDPINVQYNLNGCLFAAVSAQTEKSVNDLRTSVVNFLANNTEQLIDQIDRFERNGTLLMIGGARYNGTSPNDAARILDNSQNVLCHTCYYTGHPRGHASDLDATGTYDSVENYSWASRSMKSGFLNRDDQNYVAHLALKHADAQQAMQRLNNGARSQAITLARRDLETNGNTLPKMKEFYNGEEYTGELDIIRVTLVLRHHEGKENDPDADVFVHTFYPRSN